MNQNMYPRTSEFDPFAEFCLRHELGLFHAPLVFPIIQHELDRRAREISS